MFKTQRNDFIKFLIYTMLPPSNDMKLISVNTADMKCERLWCNLFVLHYFIDLRTLDFNS